MPGRNTMHPKDCMPAMKDKINLSEEYCFTTARTTFLCLCYCKQCTCSAFTINSLMHNVADVWFTF